MAAPGVTLKFNNQGQQQLNLYKQTIATAKREMSDIERRWKQMDKAGQARDPASIARYSQLESARNRAQGVINEEKETKEFYHEQAHDAHMTERITGRVIGTLRTAGSVLSGNAGFKDVVRQVISDDRTIARVAQSFGASARTIGLLRAGGMLGAAALEGWEIGTAIREKVEKVYDEIEKADAEVAKGKMAASLRDVLENSIGEHWYSSKTIATGLGLGNGEKDFKAMGDFASALGGANAQDIGSSLVALHRDGALQTQDTEKYLANLGLFGSSLLYKAVFGRDQVNQKEDIRLGQELARDIQEGIRAEQTRQHVTNLDEDTIKRINQDAAVGFAKLHGLNHEQTEKLAETLNSAKERQKKIISPDQAYWNHEMHMEDEARLSLRGKRIPANLID